MLVSACPACGKHRPMGLGVEGPLTCPSCSHRAELSAAERTAVTAARQALFNAPLRRRQLLAGDSFIVNMASVRHRLAVVFAVIALPLGSCALFGVIALVDLVTHPHDPYRARAWVFLPALLVPFTLLALLGAGIRRRFAQATVATLAELSARPQGKDGKLACRVCGGPLPKLDLDRQVCRCAFCSSDNLVDAAIVARTAGAEVVTYADLQQQVLLRAHRSTRSLTVRAFVRLAVPVVAAIALWLGGNAADRIVAGMHRPVNEALRYDAIACPRKLASGEVIAFVDFDAEGWSSGGEQCGLPPELAKELSLTGHDDYGETLVPVWRGPLALRTLVGRDVGEPGESNDPIPISEVWNPVRITGVSSDGYGRNWLDGVRLGKDVRMEPTFKRYFGPWPPR